MKKKYIQTIYENGDIHHSFSVYDARYGAVEFQYDVTKSEYFIGGVEKHSLKPLYYMDKDYSSHYPHCDKLYGQECWHDGSSLAADKYQPFIDDSATIFVMLENDLRARIEDDNEQTRSNTSDA